MDDRCHISVTWEALEALASRSKTGMSGFSWEDIGGGLYQIEVTFEVAREIERRRASPEETTSDVIIRVCRTN